METNNHELKVLLQTAARVKVIEERFDRHFTQISEMISDSMDKIDRKFESTEEKIDVLCDKFVNARIDAVEKHGNLKAKISGLSAIIAVIISFVTTFIHDKLNK